MNIDFGRVSQDYARFRDRLPDILFEQFSKKGIHFHGKDVIDLGAGTGLFSRDLALRGARVIGIEPSEELIKAAMQSAHQHQAAPVRYIQAFAEHVSLPGKYPIITAVRAWHWFDRLKVIKNIKNLLESGGLLIVINSVFLPDSDIAKATFEVLRNNRIELKPAGSHADVKERRTGFPVNWFDEWKAYSLNIIHEWEQDYMLKYTHEEWCGKIRSVSWMANADEALKTRVTSELMKRLAEFDQWMEIPHRYSVVVLKNEQKS